jgi:hypothetical protein
VKLDGISATKLPSCFGSGAFKKGAEKRGGVAVRLALWNGGRHTATLQMVRGVGHGVHIGSVRLYPDGIGRYASVLVARPSNLEFSGGGRLLLGKHGRVRGMGG